MVLDVELIHFIGKSDKLQQRYGRSTTRRSINFRIFGEVIGELRRVTWPTTNETFRLTLMVLAVAAVLGVVLGAADLVFGWVFDTIL
ncbi:MAG: preprotein translocase subunit SecE [Dehalococcoidia bacterium]|nr:preprotein translocase subunit SecE [Dehalococcoidia bacterium]